jgi:hypothetical protein
VVKNLCAGIGLSFVAAFAGVGTNRAVADEVICKPNTTAAFTNSHNPIWGAFRPSCDLIHLQDNPHHLKGWIRGWAKVDRSTGIIDVAFELETDHVSLGPCGKADAELWGQGQQLAHIVMFADPEHDQKGACRGGKMAPTAQASVFSYQASVAPSLAAQVDRVDVHTQYLGTAGLDINIKPEQVMGALRVAVGAIVGQ